MLGLEARSAVHVHVAVAVRKLLKHSSPYHTIQEPFGLDTRICRVIATLRMRDRSSSSG